MSADDVAARLHEALQQNWPLDGALDAVLEFTEGRATGLWRLTGDALALIGFRAVRAMPLDVQRGFAEATARVPLSQTGLGIVRAVVSASPTIMEREPGNADLSTSPGWLARFDCARSLVVPIRHGGRIVGAIAVSTNAEVGDGSRTRVCLDAAAVASSPLFGVEP